MVWCPWNFDFLQQTPQMLFTLALVELQVCELGTKGAKPLLVIPQVVDKQRGFC